MCNRCAGKGYRESWHGGAGGWTSSIQQCCDVSKYSAEVQKRLNAGHVTKERSAVAEQDKKCVIVPFHKPTVAEFNGT
jgi:hypothetical protein